MLLFYLCFSLLICKFGREHTFTYLTCGRFGSEIVTVYIMTITFFIFSAIQCHLLWFLLYLGWCWYPYFWGGSECRCKGCLHHVMFCICHNSWKAWYLFCLCLWPLFLILSVLLFLEVLGDCATCSVWHRQHATSCLPTWAVALV